MSCELALQYTIAAHVHSGFYRPTNTAGKFLGISRLPVECKIYLYSSTLILLYNHCRWQLEQKNSVNIVH